MKAGSVLVVLLGRADLHERSGETSSPDPGDSDPRQLAWQASNEAADAAGGITPPRWSIDGAIAYLNWR
jgi:hypothetical protein